MNYALYIIFGILILSTILYLIYKYKFLYKTTEPFNTIDNCIEKGYPEEFCNKLPYEINDELCGCPYGFNSSRRYGRCECIHYGYSYN